METQKVELFFSSKGDLFPSNQILALKNRLSNQSDDRYVALDALKFKNPVVALVLSILLGGLGADRFYLGDTGLGVVKLLTCGGAGVWTIIDWFKASNAAKNKNVQILMNAC